MPAVRPESTRHRSVRGTLRLALLLSLAPWVTGSAHAEQIEPYVPANANVVLAQVPPSTDPRVRHFEQLRELARRSPADEAKAVSLADAYIDYARSTGDARYLGRAMAVIEPFMARPKPSIAVWMAHATIQQSRHLFQPAREELGRILKRDPDDAQAWLTLATVAMVQGDVAEANRDCVQLANVGGSFMGLVCSAALRSVTGHAAQAYALLSMDEDPGPEAPPAIMAWLQGLLADTAERLGRTAEADAHFRKALQWAPGDNFLLAAYGSFLIDQGRPQQAIDLVRGDTQSDTSMLVLVAAEAALGAPDAAKHAAEMQARFKSMAERGDHVFMREESAFALHVMHDPAAALALARQNWAVQRAPKDVRVYLEAALATHDAAAPVLAFIDRTGLRDVSIDPLVARLREQNGRAATMAAASAGTR